MIPEFTENGELPPGIHSASWGEFSARFVRFNKSDRRLRIGDDLRALYDEARQSGIVVQFFVAGSFVTDKAEPNDFDCLVAIDPSIVGTTLSAAGYNLVSRRKARRMFRGDVVPTLDNSQSMREYMEFFQTSRDGRRVGIVEVAL